MAQDLLRQPDRGTLPELKGDLALCSKLPKVDGLSKASGTAPMYTSSIEGMMPLAHGRELSICSLTYLVQNSHHGS